MRRVAVRTAVAICLVVAAGAAAAVLLSWVSFGAFLWKVAYEQPFRQKQFERIASAIESGQLRPDSASIVQLSGGERRLVQDGSVYVTRLKDGTHLVLFVTWRSKGRNLKGYLYSSRPLRRSDMSTPPRQGRPGWIEVVVPRPSFQGSQPSDCVEVQLDRQLTPSWHRVSYALD
jgi:hypothetical protein